MLGHRKLNADDYLAIIKRRRLLIAIPVLILPIITYAATFFIPAIYVSQSLILIEEKKVPDEVVRSIITTQISSRISSMKERALSRTRLEPIVVRYNLYGSKRLNMDDRLDLTRRAISVRPLNNDLNRSAMLPGFVISYTAGDAHTAQQVCGDITSLFITENLRFRQDATVSTTDFLKKQLEDAKRSLDEQDASLAAFQRQYIGKLPGQDGANGNMLTSLSTQLDATSQALARMQQDKELQQSLLAQQLQFSPSTSYSPSGVPVQSAPQTDQLQLQSLLAQESELTAHYTDSYPDVIAVRHKITDLRKKIAATPPPPPVSASTSATPAPNRNESPSVQQLRAQIRSSDLGIKEKQHEQAVIQNNMRVYQERIESSPLVEAKYKELTRDYETARRFYDEILGKINRTKMENDLERGQEGEQFTLLDGANLPDAPTFPKPWLFVLGGIAGGLAIGLILAAFKEYNDTSLRTEQDVWAFTRLPTLAVIAYSGVIELPYKKPGMFARFKNLFGRKLPADEFSKANS